MPSQETREAGPAVPARLRESFGGVASVVGGLLLAARAVVDLSIGAPPPGAAALLGWRDAHGTALAWSSELAVFSAILLLPVALALYRRLDGPRRPWAGFGCSILAATVPLALVVAVLRGRLTYPVYGIALATPAASPW